MEATPIHTTRLVLGDPNSLDEILEFIGDAEVLVILDSPRKRKEVLIRTNRLPHTRYFVDVTRGIQRDGKNLFCKYLPRFFAFERDEQVYPSGAMECVDKPLGEFILQETAVTN